jgi:hypothetical protein
MKTNEKIRTHILEIVGNQLEENNPPETQITYDRLISEGFNDIQVRQLIAQCVAVEIFEVMKYGKPYDNNRYIKNLKKLPQEPFE